MTIVNKTDVEKSKQDAILTIESLFSNTELNDNDECKRINNYYQWVKTHTDFVLNESKVKCADEDKLIRGSVVWVEFGFNVGNEFGGKHPAIILRKTGNSVFVIPLSSQKPDKIQKWHVKVDKVYKFKDLTRWANVLKLQNVSIQRIDTNASIGNVKGKVLDDINQALRKCHIF